MTTTLIDDEKSQALSASAGIGTVVGVRLQPDDMRLLDYWIAQHHPGMKRPEALRLMLRAMAASEPDQR